MYLYVHVDASIYSKLTSYPKGKQTFCSSKDKEIGKDYLYPHNFGGYVQQQYLPDNLYEEGVKYYRPTANGSEASFKKFLEGLEEKYGRNHKG